MEQKIMIDCVIGIDPGASGGIAIFQPGKNTKTVKMPKDVKDLRDFFAYYAENFKPIVFLEKLSVRMDDVNSADDPSVNRGKIFRIQKMMENYVELKTIMESSGIPYVMVHPMSWQTKLKLRKPGMKEEKADRKKRFRRTAGEFYPEINPTLWNADALLIMHFGRYALVNEPQWVRANMPQDAFGRLF